MRKLSKNYCVRRKWDILRTVNSVKRRLEEYANMDTMDLRDIVCLDEVNVARREEERRTCRELATYELLLYFGNVKDACGLGYKEGLKSLKCLDEVNKKQGFL
jgi:hypothetical protein